ncbi:MAG TPA: CBS domain-containing protein [Blastocatellia bacterium]
MSLKWYERPRLVALNADTPALEAARAIENNNIGAVVVQSKGAVVGIVTDRDLAVRVVGRGLDPKTTLLADIMTTPVVTLSPKNSQSDAIRLMQERNIRRIPLVEGSRLVGLVTLDDLLLDEAAPIDQLAAIVQAQIGEGGLPTSPRLPSMKRRAARAEATYSRLLHQLQANAALESIEEAEAALDVVLKALVRRLTDGEAKDLIAQLPSLLQPTLMALPPGPDKLITKSTIEADLAHRLGVDPLRAAQILSAVGRTIAQTVSPGQIKDTQSQLPADLRGIFSDVRQAAA